MVISGGFSSPTLVMISRKGRGRQVVQMGLLYLGAFQITNTLSANPHLVRLWGEKRLDWTQWKKTSIPVRYQKKA